MSQFGFFARFVGFMFLVGLLAVGGFLVYQAGMVQGIAQTPDLAEATQTVTPLTLELPPLLSFFGAICVGIFFLFLFFGLVRFLSCAVRFGREGQTPNSDFGKAV
jgi:hypothetical protein